MNRTATAIHERFYRAITPVTVSAALLVLGIAAVLILFWDDWRRMARVWATSETFAHGALIAPVSLWLLWRARLGLAYAPIRPWPMPLIGLALCGALWLVGELASVNAAREFAIVGMLVLMAALVTGPRATRIALFPLVFLFFMVPFGEFLLPWMMDSTANFTVWALRLTGIPVYREGLHFVIPSGRWSVVEACSGLRYLIASAVLGVVYAYLSFRSPGKRAIFVGLAIAVPVFANWLRAFGIVMIGHVSSMELAAGVDHLIYGWLFFGVVMFLLYWIGARWRDPPAPATAGESQIPVSTSTDARRAGNHSSRVAAFGQVIPWAASVALLVGVQLLADHLQQRTTILPLAQRIASSLPDLDPDSLPLGFRPAFLNTRGELLGLLRAPEPHGVQVAYYARQHETAEMVAYGNAVVRSSDKQWHVTREAPEVLNTPTGAIPVRRYDLVSASGERLLLLHWFTVAGVDTSSATVAKLLMAGSLLNGSGDHSVSTAVWVLVDRDVTENDLDELLRRLTSKIAPIRTAIAQAMR